MDRNASQSKLQFGNSASQVIGLYSQRMVSAAIGFDQDYRLHASMQSLQFAHQMADFARSSGVDSQKVDHFAGYSF
jgi:hypothetical protein